MKAMPASHDMYGLGFDPHAAAIVHFTALYPLEMRHWADAAALTPAAIAGKEEDCDIYWARAIGAAHS